MNLGHSLVSKLVVFEGDEPTSVVENFANINNLSEDKKRKLMKVVNEQMAAILPRIEEGDEDEHREES